VAVAGQGGQAGRDHRGLVDRRLVDFLEVAQQPARSHTRMPARILSRDQDRQVERVLEAERRQLFRRRLGDEQVPALYRSVENGPGLPLRGRLRSSPGPRRLPKV